MGTERVSSLVLSFDGEAGSIDSVLAGIKSRVTNAVKELEATTGRVQLFGQLSDNIPKIQAAIDRSTAAAAGFRKELESIAASGAVPLKVVSQDLAAAEKAASKATAELAKQNRELASLNATLKATGVDTTNLAAAQGKLAAQTREAAAAAELQAAKQALNVKTLADIQPQLAKLQTAYNTLRDSGKLSGAEQSAAQQQLALRVKETTGQVTVATTGWGQLKATAGDALTSTLGRFLTVTAAVTTFTAALSASIEASKAYKQGVAEIGTVSNLSKAELDDLGVGVRKLAQELGFDLQAGLKATFDLIRSGVAPGNALEVLAISAEAAKAGLTDIGTTAKISQILLDGFGHTVGDLRSDFDALVQGSKDGGATLKEFAESGAPLANVARAAGVQFRELVAILAVMTNQSQDAAGSASALTKILLRIGDSDVRAKLRAIGIDTTNVLEIFKQLGAQGRSLDFIIDLGLASTRTAAGVAALTNAAGKLPAELEAINASAGIVKRTTDDLFDSPRERAERFNAALEETKVKIGTFVGSGSLLAAFGTQLLGAFNNGIKATGDLDTQLGLAFAGANLLEGEIAKAAGEANTNLDQTDRVLQRVAATAAESGRKVADSNKVLRDSGAALTEEIKALQAASARDVADLNALADRQIAALDRGVNAQAATAAKTIAIQTKFAADRLTLIQKTEAAITAAVDAAAIAQNKTAEETAKLRIDALAPVLVQYQQHYASLVAAAQQYKGKIDSIEQERVAFNRGIEDTLLAIRNQSSLSALSALDLFSQKVRLIDQAIADARQAGLDGNIAKAKEYTDRAIALSGTLKEVVNRDGVTIISSFDAQTTATNKIKAAAEGYNKALDGASDSAKEGLAETRKGLDAVIPKLEDVQKRYDALKATIAEGLEIKVRFDERAIAEAKAAIDEIVRARTVQVTVETSGGSAVPTGGGFAAGGYIGPIQRFAGGGGVFRVPGEGYSDSVATRLPVGSFVLRRAASAEYGGAALAKIARGYATGGKVDPASFLFGKGDPFGGLNAGPTSYQSFFDANQSKSSDYIGNIQSGTTQSVRDVGQIAPPKLPTDRNELVRKVLEYANAVVVAANPEAYIFQRAIVELNAELRQFDRTQNLDILMQALQTARAIGLNIGISNGDLHGFDVDGRKWHRETAFGSFGALGLSPGAGSYSFFAKGGNVDSVPAMLTPGEFVFSPEAVSAISHRFGGEILPALNAMRVSSDFLAGMRSFAPPAPRVARFAEGGPVGYVSASIHGRTTTPAARGGPVIGSVVIYTNKLDDRTIDEIGARLGDRVRRAAGRGPK